MYYIIERNYVGPNQNQEQYVDSHYVLIQTEPGRTNSSQEERTEGWLGTTNDWAVYAHGEYSTVEAARAAIAEKFGDCREASITFEDPDTIVEIYNIGEYTPMSEAATTDWLAVGIAEMVSADTTDEQIEEMIGECVGEMRSEGYALDERALEQYMTEYRQDLRDEAAE